MNHPNYSIMARIPSVEDYLHLRAVAGLSPFPREAAEKGLRGTVFSVLVLQEDSANGMGRIIGDGGCFFSGGGHRRQARSSGPRAGQGDHECADGAVKTEFPASAYVSLIADVPANKLYEKFGFKETAPPSPGMAYRVNVSG